MYISISKSQYISIYRERDIDLYRDIDIYIGIRAYSHAHPRKNKVIYLA